MATSTSIPDAIAPSTAGGLVVLLAAMPPDQMECLLTKITESFPSKQLIVATEDESAAEAHPDLRIVQLSGTGSSWSLTAMDFVQAHELASQHGASGVLMLGPESASLEARTLQNLANTGLDAKIDLAIPRYSLPPRSGLINSAILYPLTRSLFASRVRFPLAIDLGLSMRMVEKLANVARRFANVHQAGALVWPASEACVAGFSVFEVEAGLRSLPQPAQQDLNAILPLVTGSLFADVERKAAYWQRARQLAATRSTAPPAPVAAAETTDVAAMIQGFRLAYSNLLEIWSLVLPPNTLLGLKRLSMAKDSEFRLSESLWARIVFDFALAYRLHTINRGHLLGALIPLYLAWVASHVNVTTSGVDPEQHIEATAAAFELEKPYLLSRWRWPDRFNP